MDELYEEDFASPRTQLEKGGEVQQVAEITAQQVESHPFSYYVSQLEKAIHDECPRPEIVLPYIKMLHKEVEKKDPIVLLKLLDEVEEMLDVSFGGC